MRKKLVASLDSSNNARLARFKIATTRPSRPLCGQQTEQQVIHHNKRNPRKEFVVSSLLKSRKKNSGENDIRRKSTHFLSFSSIFPAIDPSFVAGSRVTTMNHATKLAAESSQRGKRWKSGETWEREGQFVTGEPWDEKDDTVVEASKLSRIQPAAGSSGPRPLDFRLGNDWWLSSTYDA